MRDDKNYRYIKRRREPTAKEKRAVKRILSMKHGAIILAVLLVLSGVVYYLYESRFRIAPDANAEFHFIDVGQGDAAMIRTDEVTVLVDCGIRDEYEDVAEYIGRYTDVIDLFVFSHAHDDHMGGAADIISSFEVKEVLLTSYVSDAAFYGRALDAIEEHGVKVTEALAGKSYTVGDVKVDIFSPAIDYEDLNNNSIIMRVEVDGASAMFTGDAEFLPEKDVVATYGMRLKSNILKVGHHGSSTSTCEDFLYAVAPDYAVISCGEGNSYGHPHREMVAMLRERNIETHRTDKEGNIVFICSDGAIRVKSETE